MQKQNVAVWGHGRVGSSVAYFLSQKGHTVTVYDAHITRRHSHARKQITYAPEQYIHTDTFDALVPSPGIDINAYPALLPYCIPEYDLYTAYSNTPHIGITGSIGKTSITLLLSQSLSQAGFTIEHGGNIGIPMFALLTHGSPCDFHVLEISSFQLEHIQRAAPDIAIITNIYPNHLDRHGSFEAYNRAKWNIIRYQSPAQQALIPITFRQTYRSIHPHRTCAVFARSSNEYNMYAQTLDADDILYFHESGAIYRSDKHHVQCVLAEMSAATLAENWLIVAAVHDMLSTRCAPSMKPRITAEHRCEYIGTYAGIACYDDAKSTIMQATIAATRQLAHTYTTLLLGGVSKGIDRHSDIGKLKPYASYVICFGAEARYLYTACCKHGIPATHCSTLTEAVRIALTSTPKGGNIVLSPGGASFDLYASYEDRGKAFRRYLQEQT